MPLQLNIFLLLFGGLQGLLLSFFLLSKKLHRSGYIFLLLYLGVLLLQITLKVMSKVWLMTNWPILYSLSHILPLLYGPLAFLFIKNLLKQGQFNGKDLLHFLPALFIGFYVAFTYTRPGFEVLDLIIFRAQSRPVLLITSLTVYHGLAWYYWQNHRRSLQQFFSDTAKLQMNWLQQFIVISYISGLLITAALYLLYMNYPNGHEYRYAFLILTVVIYWFSYTALTKPAVFSVIKGLSKDNADRPFTAPALKVYHPPAKYSSSGLSEEQLQHIILSLDVAMRKDKLFLQPDLTINKLAEKLNCSRHHLSQALNERLKKSYYDYVNQWRVEEAKELLRAALYQPQKIASVAYDAGFNSLSTFNEVFRKMTGQTPSQYRRQAEIISRQRRV